MFPVFYLPATAEVGQCLRMWLVSAEEGREVERKKERVGMRLMRMLPRSGKHKIVGDKKSLMISFFAFLF